MGRNLIMINVDGRRVFVNKLQYIEYIKEAALASGLGERITMNDIANYEREFVSKYGGLYVEEEGEYKDRNMWDTNDNHCDIWGNYYP